MFDGVVVIVVSSSGVGVADVVEYYLFLINIIVSIPGPWPPRLAYAVCTFLSKVSKWPRRNDDRQIRDILL